MPTEELRKVKFSEYFKNRIKDIPFAVMCALYMAFCVGCMIYSFITLGARDGLLAIVYMVFIPAVFVFEYLIGFKVGYILTVMIIFSACGGLLGSSYNIYMILPWFDGLLHAVSGVLFFAAGFMLGEVFFGNTGTGKNFFGKLAFGIFFATTIGVAWEFFEFTVTETMGFDMQEDSIVTHFKSYLLSQSHNEAVELNDIYQTVIYHGGGDPVTIEGGYMDLGLYDTMYDLLIATAGTVVIAVVSTLSYYKFPRFNEMFIPKLVDNRHAPVTASVTAGCDREGEEYAKETPPSAICDTFEITTEEGEKKLTEKGDDAPSNE